MPKNVLIMGAAGKDFHVFNTCYRQDPESRVVAFTATQIPHISDRRYPASLAGKLYPDGVDWSRGVLSAFANDPYLLHFLHRWWAWAVVAALVIFSRIVRRAGSRPASIAIHTAFGTQIILGIATVMTGIDVPVAVLHQSVGALVLASTVWGAHVLGEVRR